MKNKILVVLTGFLMAIADSIPGVSGSTISYILGQYDKLINALNELTTKQPIAKMQKAIKFIITLGSGWIIGFIASILLISALINDYIYEFSSLFLGLIIFAIPFIIKTEKAYLKQFKHSIFLVIGIIVIVIIAYFSKTHITILANNLRLLDYVFIFIAGIVVISTMLLPGISGSTILVIFSLYIPIVNAIKDILSLDFSGIEIVVTFGIGILVGLKLVSKIIAKILANYRSQMIYLIIGLMLGSLYAIIVSPTTLVNEVTNESLNLAPLSLQTFSLSFFTLGFIIIVVLEFIKEKLSN